MIKDMVRLRRSSVNGSASSLSRRSSISQKDIQAIQEAIQKQQILSSTVILWLFFFLPTFSFAFLYSITAHQLKLWETFYSLFLEPPFLFRFPALYNGVAFKICAVNCAIQLIFYWVLPHDKALVMSSSGDQLRDVNSFYSCILTCLLYILGASSGIYSGDIIYIHFDSIILEFAIAALLILLYLYLLSYYGNGNTISNVNELYFGIEAHPKLLDIDIKYFLRTRFTLNIWPLYIISAMYNHKIMFGSVSTSLCIISFLQLFYISHFHWNEDLYLNSLDAKRSNCGFYRLWSDLVLHPIIYTSPVNMITKTNSSLFSVANVALIIIGLCSIVLTFRIDRQKYQFRKSKGQLKINGIDPFFIIAKYRTENGDPNFNLLLGSGYWRLCRHPNYLGESITFWVFCALQGFPSFLSYLPAYYIMGFLAMRAIIDENRCLIKYGQNWIQYCTKVKYQIFPGIY